MARARRGRSGACQCRHAELWRDDRQPNEGLAYRSPSTGSSQASASPITAAQYPARMLLAGPLPVAQHRQVHAKLMVRCSRRSAVTSPPQPQVATGHLGTDSHRRRSGVTGFVSRWHPPAAIGARFAKQIHRGHRAAFSAPHARKVEPKSAVVIVNQHGNRSGKASPLQQTFLVLSVQHRRMDAFIVRHSAGWFLDCHRRLVMTSGVDDADYHAGRARISCSGRSGGGQYAHGLFATSSSSYNRCSSLSRRYEFADGGARSRVQPFPHCRVPRAAPPFLRARLPHDELIRKIRRSRYRSGRPQLHATTT